MTFVVPGYEEVRELGRGASGRVVLATHSATGTRVAIKYLANSLRRDSDFLRDFRAEARLLAEVSSPHVAPLYEYVESGSGAAIVMELVDGVTLRSLLTDDGPLRPEAALVVLKGSLLGLAAAHDRSVVHRDYKPANVLVDQTGQSKLADFGIATRSGRDVPVAGTPAYMAPEQWNGAPATPASDIYAATATFFECLTGAPPYPPTAGIPALALQHMRAPIPVERVPAALHGLLNQGLAKDPKDRPSHATQLLASLESVARASYGADWETSGRQQLARRVALLSLLLPSLGGAAGVAAAATALGAGVGVFGSSGEPSGSSSPPGSSPPGSAPPGSAPPGTGPGRGPGGGSAPGGGPVYTPAPLRVPPGTVAPSWRPWDRIFLGAGLSLVLLLGGFGYLALRPAALATDIPTALTVVTPGTTPSATPSPSATPVEAPSESPTVSSPTVPGHTTTTTAPPPPPPPPPPLAINSITFQYFDDPGPPNHPATPSHLQAKVNVSTNLPGAFTLTMTFQTTDGAATTPITLNFNRSGSTSYLVDSGVVNIGAWCFHKSFKVTASALGVSNTSPTVTFTNSVFC